MKNTTLKKALSVLLCAVMVLSTMTVGLSFIASAATNGEWYPVEWTGTTAYSAPPAGSYIIVDPGDSKALVVNNGTLGLNDFNSTAKGGTVLTFTKSGSNFTIRNSSNYYLRTNRSGALQSSTNTDRREFTITATGPNTVTIKHNYSGKYLDYSDGAFTLVSSPVELQLYTYTPATAGQAATTNYVYKIDEDGIDVNDTYIIAGISVAYALEYNGSSLVNTSLSQNGISRTSDCKTITSNREIQTWKFSGSSSASIKWAGTSKNIYLQTNNGTIGTATSEPTNKFSIAVVDDTPDGYELKFTYRSNGQNRTRYIRGDNNAIVYSSTQSHVWLYKLESEPHPAIPATPESYDLVANPVDPNNTTQTPVKWAKADYTEVNLVVGYGDTLITSLKDAYKGDGEKHLYTNNKANDDGAQLIDATDPNYMNFKFDVSGVDTNKIGSYNVIIKYEKDGNSVELGTAKVNVIAEKEITSVLLVNETGSVYLGSDQNAKTGAYIRVTYVDGSSALKPITLNMVRGSYDVSTLGKYKDLQVFYNNRLVDGGSSFTLNVVDKEQYPEYPEKGSVRINKTANAPDFSENGVAQVELTATGIPMQPGIDIVFVLDTSSSMTSNMGTYKNREVYCEGKDTSSRWFYADDGEYAGITNNNNSNVTNKVSRHDALQSSLNNIINNLEAYGVNGVKRDIQIAICDFNGYTQIDKSNDKLASVDMISTNTADKSMVYTGPNAGTKVLDADAFVDIETLINDVPTLQSVSGTNYDRAMVEAYTLVKAKQERNELNGEKRDQYVIFMSDGGSFQYNYITGNSEAANSNAYNEWNDWLLGTWDSYTDVPYATNCSHKYFYNGAGNKHRLAAAIAGDPNETYTIINRENKAGSVDVTGDGKVDPYMENVNGLGATLYSIGFCICTDMKLERSTIDANIKKMASSEEYYYDAKSATALDDAFNTIIGTFTQAGTDAYFTDTLGAAYDIQLASQYDKNDINYSLDPAPTMEINSYIVYTRSDYENGIIHSEDQIGMRTGEKTHMETISFSTDGTKAYSDQLGANNNILSDGIICGKYLFFNTTDDYVKIDGDGDGTPEYDLAPETFYWRIGIVEQIEYTLNYWVYLNGSMEGTRPAGTYPTNESAVLYYRNYQGYFSQKPTVSPRLPWKSANLSYEFYLVNEQGLPVNSKGDVVPFSQRVLVGNMQSQEVLLNNTETKNAEVSADGKIPAGYTLYNPDASYKITIASGNSDESHAEINDEKTISGREDVTTYFYDQQNMYHFDGMVPDNQVSDYTNTHVAFAVILKPSLIPDAVVIDYGIPVQISVLANDLCIEAGTTINSIGMELNTEKPEEHLYNVGHVDSLFAKKKTALGKTDGMGHGTAEIVDVDDSAGGYDSKVVYTPTDAEMSEEEILYYEVIIEGKYYYSTVTVYPAQNIYYEEDFFTFTDSGDYKWQNVGTRTGEFQAEDRPGTFNFKDIDFNNVYGYDAVYDGEKVDHSLGTAKYITVDIDTPLAKGERPQASFVFCGTGFDFFSVTSHATGTLRMEVINNATGKRIKYLIVDTYYGVDYDGDAENTFSVGDDKGTLCQVPVMRVRDLDYATYTVNVIPYYDEVFDNTDDENDSYDVYVDGVRIYDPAGPEPSETIQKVYEQDTEAYAQYLSLRTNIIAANDFYKLANKETVKATSITFPGYMYIDGIDELSDEKEISEIYDKFLQFGPNNEVYLKQGQAIAFYYQLDNCRIAPDTIQLGMKVVGGNNANGSVYVMNSASDKPVNISVKGSAARYYDITDHFVWNESMLSNNTRKGLSTKEVNGLGAAKITGDYTADEWTISARGSGYGSWYIKNSAGYCLQLTGTSSSGTTAEFGPDGIGDDFFITPSSNGACNIKQASESSNGFSLSYNGVICGTDYNAGEFFIYKANYKAGEEPVYTKITDFENELVSGEKYLIVYSAVPNRIVSPVSVTYTSDSSVYRTLYPIVIMNNSDCIISLTNLKTAFDNVEALGGVTPVSTFSSNSYLTSFALSAIKNYALNPVYVEEKEVDTSAISMQWDSTDLELGAQATLTIRTPGDITSVTVGETKLTDFVVNGDGTKTWTYKFVVTEDSQGNYVITVEDSEGNIGEVSAKTLTVIGLDDTDETDDTDTPETPDNPGEEETGFWAFIKRLARRILTFFQKIVRWFISLW